MWTVKAECFSIDPPFATPECQSAVPDPTSTVAGTVSYVPSATDPGSGTEQIDVQYHWQIQETYSAACLHALGLGSASAESCNGLQSYWAGAYEVTCGPAGGSCACEFSDERSVQASDTYTVQGSQLVLAQSGAVDFCRTGDTLVELGTTGSGTSHLMLERTP